MDLNEVQTKSSFFLEIGKNQEIEEIGNISLYADIHTLCGNLKRITYGSKKKSRLHSSTSN